MRIGVLSRRSSLYSTDRLRAAGRERGHDVEVVDYLRCTMNIATGKPSVMYRGAPLAFDAVIPRIGASHSFYGAAVVRQFEVMGVPAANGSQAIARASDKLRSLQLLAREGVGMPVTAIAHSIREIDALLEAVGGPPVIIKLVTGTQGQGVVLAETREAAESVISAFHQLDANILVQEFIGEARGTDVRVIVVGGRAVAAMRREARAGEFRANLHRGGEAYPTELTADERRTAEAAVRCLGLGVAGVDLLRSDRGPLVIDVNASPGLEGIETATSIDVAGAIVEFLARTAAAAPGGARPGPADQLSGGA